MPNKSYNQATDWLFHQFPSYQQIGSQAFKPTLENTKKLIAALEIDLTQSSIVHVAGTNGKGSVCSFIASACTEAGLRTGLFTSPHILDFRERIRIDGEMINQEEVIRFVKHVQQLNLEFEPSFFEITFVMAMKHFIQNNCDYCIIETGLGGRLDATNIVHPIISIITSIGLEHTQLLGETLEEIAAEKAGIIKTQTPVVLGEDLVDLKRIFEKVAVEKNAPLNVVPKEKDLSWFDLPFLDGSYQYINLRTAITTLELIDKELFNKLIIQRGIDNLAKNTGYKCRLQKVQESPIVILDAAHNKDGIKKTIEAIQQMSFGKLHIIMGTSNDKDHIETTHILPDNAHYYFTVFPHERSANLEQLRSWFNALKAPEIEYFQDPLEAYSKAAVYADKNDVILIMGSFFLLENFFSFFACE